MTPVQQPAAPARTTRLPKLMKTLNDSARHALHRTAQLLAMERIGKRWTAQGARSVGYTVNTRYERWKKLRTGLAMPMVLTGALQFAWWRGVNLRTTATKGEASSRLTVRLGVKTKKGGYVAPKPIIRQVLGAVTDGDRAYVTAQFRRFRRRLLRGEAPASLGDWWQAKAMAMQRVMGLMTNLQAESIRRRNAGQNAKARTHKRWSRVSGGSAPLINEPGKTKYGGPALGRRATWRSAAKTYRRSPRGRAMRRRYAARTYIHHPRSTRSAKR